MVDRTAARQVDDAVGGGRVGLVMGDQDNRHGMASGQCGQQGHQITAALGVDHGGGLVGDEQRGLPGQGGGRGEPLLLAAGQGRGLAAAHARQSDLGQQGFDIHGGGVGGGQAPHHVVGDEHAEGLAFRALQHHGGAAAHAEARRAGAGHRSAGSWAAREKPGERGLSGSVVADDGHELADRDREIDAGQRVGARPWIAEGDAAQGDR